jgi:hypothetical protein
LEEEFKIKPLTKQQIIISLDRLTRFKFTEDKYLRVFKEIISSNLLLPKYKKKELDDLSNEKLTQLADAIFNYSIPNKFSRCRKINKKLLKYEKSVFVFDQNVQKMLENNINFRGALQLFSQDMPLNLKWLKLLLNDNDQRQNRSNFAIKFPLEKIIIAEGITEEILLPKFARICGYDFDKEGVSLISAGGKNQVVKLFYQFADILKLPMYVLLDSDAEDNYEQIKKKIRKKDKIYIIKKGEFEDILPLNLVKKTINAQSKDFSQISLEDLRKDMPMTKILEDVFKSRGQEFKKAEFASLIGENISSKKDVSDEIENIIEEISTY